MPGPTRPWLMARCTSSAPQSESASQSPQLPRLHLRALVRALPLPLEALSLPPLRKPSLYVKDPILPLSEISILIDV